MREKQLSESKSLRGIDVLTNPTLNKGTGFTQRERKDLGLIGLLPAGIETIDQQVERVLGHLAQKPTDLERYIYLIGLEDRNETLFYKVVMSDPERFLPIVYDPTVGEALIALGYDRDFDSLPVPAVSRPVCQQSSRLTNW